MKQNELYNRRLEEIYLVNKYNKTKANYFNCAGISIGLLMGISGFWKESLLSILIGKCISYSNKNKLLYNYHEYYTNSLEFKDALQCYKIILEELGKMTDILGWDNEMKLFSGYSYLLKQGYLSLGHEFRYSVYCDSCKYLWGNNIMIGLGNCKHISSMFSDLLRSKGYYSYNLSVFLDNDIKVSHLNNMELLEVDEENVDIPEIYDTNSIIDKLLFTFRLKRGELTNHLVTLFVDKEHSYVMDSTNDLVFLVGDDLKFYGIDSNCIGDGFIRSLFNNEEKIDLSNMLKKTSKTLLDSRLDDYKAVWDSCSDLIDVFEKFYVEHKELYEEVVAKRKVLLREYNKYSI